MATAAGIDAREAIFSILYRVEATRAFSTVLLHRTLDRNGFRPPDEALITEVVLGTLRQQGRLDYALQHALSQPIDRLPRRILTVLRMGLYQCWFLDRVPAAAAVDTSVALARRHGHRGTAGLVNAVLRRLAVEGEPPPPPRESDPIGYLAVRGSHPRWLVERWLRRWGWDETERLLAADNAAPPTALRVNLLKATRESVLLRLRRRGIAAEAGRLPEALLVRGPLDERLDLYREGLVTMQDEGAMRVAYTVDPQPGETVIDATAAPGGKATHLAELMRNQGRVIAADVVPSKLQALSRQTARLGLDIVEAHHLDAREIGRRHPGVADRVLVDAPCTGTGVIRRRPEIRWRVDHQAVNQMAALQAGILEGVAGSVRPGGVLVYCVCSLEPEEGEQVVEAFVRGHPTFGLTRTELLLPQRDGTDGFFIARLERGQHGGRDTGGDGR